MVKRYEPDDLEIIGMRRDDDGDYVDYSDYAALEQELHMIDELLARRPALADFDTRVDKIAHAINTASQRDALERERDMWSGIAADQDVQLAKYSRDNALLRKRLEPIEAAYKEYKEYPLSAIVKRDAYNQAINRCMENGEGK